MAIPLVEIIGKVLDPGTGTLTNARLRFRASEPLTVSDGVTNQTIAFDEWVDLDATGAIPEVDGVSTLKLVPTAGATPAGAYYHVEGTASVDGKPRDFKRKVQVTATPARQAFADLVRIEGSPPSAFTLRLATATSPGMVQLDVDDGSKVAASAASLASKVTAAGGDASATVVTPTGSTTPRTMADVAADAGTRQDATGDVVLYVRPAGSDSTGTGSPAAPYATLMYALSRIPARTGMRRYYIDVTGIDEHVPTPAVLPHIHSVSVVTELDGSEPAGFAAVAACRDAVNVFAAPVALATAVPVALRQDLGGPTQATRITVPAASVTWTPDDLLGAFVRDAAGGLPYPVAYSAIDGVTGDAVLDVAGSWTAATIDILRCGARLYDVAPAGVPRTNATSGVINIDGPSRYHFAGVRFDHDFAMGNGGRGMVIRGARHVILSACVVALHDPSLSAPWDDAGLWYLGKAYVRSAQSAVYFERTHIRGQQFSAGHVLIRDCVNSGWRTELQNSYDGRADDGPVGPTSLQIDGLLLREHPGVGQTEITPLLFADDAGGNPVAYAKVDRLTVVSEGQRFDIVVGTPHAVALVRGSELGRLGIKFIPGQSTRSSVVLSGCTVSQMGPADDLIADVGSRNAPEVSVGIVASTFSDGIVTLPDGTTDSLATPLLMDAGQTRYDGAMYYRRSV